MIGAKTPGAKALDAWVAHIFDHPVAKPNWYFTEDDKEWEGPLEGIPDLISETFERGLNCSLASSTNKSIRDSGSSSAKPLPTICARSWMRSRKRRSAHLSAFRWNRAFEHSDRLFHCSNKS